MVHDYGDLGIGSVLSSARLGNLCFFGGWKSLSFAVVDTLTQQVVQTPVKTAVYAIDSLAVSIVDPNTPDAKAVLAVAGRTIDYSADRTDMFDVTQLGYRHGSQEVLAELPISMHQIGTETIGRMRALEQRLRELQDKNRVQATENASLRARISSLQRHLQQLSEAHAAAIEAKDREILKLELNNQALLDFSQRLKKKRARTKKRLRNQTLRNKRQLRQTLIWGLFDHSQIVPDAPKNPESKQASEMATDSADFEDLQLRLAAVQRRNQILVMLNQDLQVQIVALQAQEWTSSAPCSEW